MRSGLCAIALFVVAFASGYSALAQQPVLQRGYDAGVSGANLAETTLNTSNVNPTTFALLFNLQVDDQIFAQPLYVPQVSIPNKGIHNVVYVATMSDTLYAFDADTGGAPLWSVNFASSVGAVPVSMAKFAFSGNTNITGNLGILSTPVIDPSTNIMYLAACTMEGGTMVYRLHAVNIASGTEPYPNVVVSGSYNGVNFVPAHQTQRVSLTLSGNQVVFAFGAVEAEADDENGYSGWVMAYNKQTLAQTGRFASMTTGSTLGGGIWQSGRPPVVDSAGFVYAYTGNAYGNGYDGETNFSESALKLDPSDGLALVDWFTPDNWSNMDQQDLDLSSAGALLVPNTTPSLLAGGGKTGAFYVLNTSDLGQYDPSDSGSVQEFTIGASGLRGGPVYWQRSAANGGPLLYDWATNDAVKAFAFNGKKFATTPSYAGSGSQIYPGGILALSANGDQPGTGVLWATVATSGDVFDDATDPGALYAFDASNVATQLYSSNTNASRDNFGNFAKLVPPLIANGKVYVATFSSQVSVYGLLNPSTPMAATPTFSPAPGTYTNPQQVALADATSGAALYYTTNGTTPTTASVQYVSGTPITVSTTETIEAIAVASGYYTSAVGSGSYTISSPSTAGAVSVGLSAADNIFGIGTVGTATSNNGLDGSGHDYAANLLGSSITWSGSTFAIGSANVADMVSNATITLPSGSFTTLNMLATGINGNQSVSFVVTYTDGTTTTTNQSLSDWYSPSNNPGESIVSTMAYRINPDGTQDNRTFYLYGYSFALNSAKTVKSLALPNNRNVLVLAVDLVPPSSSSPAAATPTFSPAPGTYTGTQQVALADGTSGAAIYYTTNGTTPTTASTQYVSGTPIAVSATETIEAIAVASGYSNSAMASGAYTISSKPVAAKPTFSPAPGTYNGTQQVTLADATSGVAIYYTTNGATPTTASTRYVSGTPIAVSATETIKAIAAGTGYSNSGVASGSYTISSTPVATTPTFSPAPGTYTGTQQVSLADATSGALIYYTTNGTTPTTASAQYVSGTPITVNATETIQAVAVVSGYTNSNVASGSYTISSKPAAATPTFSPAPGTYTGTQQVALADGTSGAAIYYTTNGTTPTTASTQYVSGTPIAVSATETIEAIAVASGYSNSAMASGAYTISSKPVAAKPTFSPAPGTYNGTQQVTLADATSGVAIYYTTNGATPTTASTRYVSGTPIAVSATETIKAIAAGTGYSNSGVASGSYTISSTPVATTPTFSPAPGTYTGTQQVSLADATSGALIYYTTNGTTPTTASAQYVSGTPITVNATETIQAVAVVSGYTNSNVASGSYTISASSGTGPVSVGLSTVDNIFGLGTIGTATSNNGLDAGGHDYAANLLGTSITWSGATFSIGAANVADMVSNAMIPLPSGNYTTLKMLATGVNGDQAFNFVVTYSDGTTTAINQTLSDWYSPANHSGESIVSTMAYRVNPDGTQDNRTFYLYGYSFSLNNAKTVKSLTLPNSRNVVVLAIDVAP